MAKGGSEGFYLDKNGNKDDQMMKFNQEAMEVEGHDPAEAPEIMTRMRKAGYSEESIEYHMGEHYLPPTKGDRLRKMMGK